MDSNMRFGHGVPPRTGRVIWFAAIALLLTLAAPTNASADDRPYCVYTEPLAPNGVVLRMGTEYYRTCGLWSDDGLWRQFRLDMNPDLVPDLFSPYSPSNLTVYENVDGIDRMVSSLRMTPVKGTRMFGGIQYQSHETDVLGSNGKPSRGTYMYIVDENSAVDVPAHWVTCIGWGRLDEGGHLNCHVNVDVGEVVGTLLFIGSNQRGFGFVDHFPEFAQDIVRVLNVANVTHRLGELADKVDIVD